VKPEILGLQAHHRGKFAAVGAVGFDHFHLVLEAGVLDLAPEEFADLFAAPLFAFAAGAHIDDLIRYGEDFAHK
jgi:hypothetical protein